MSIKMCFKCKHLLNVKEFNKTKLNIDGLQNWCRSCTSKYKKQYYAKNKDSINEKKKIYRQNNKDKIKKQQHKYYLEHKGEINLHSKQYYQKNKDKIKMRVNKYSKTPQGRLVDKRHQIKRSRKLCFHILVGNDWDCEIHYHHINDNDVVPIPAYLHQMCFTNDTEKHREVCNKLINILYEDEYVFL